MTAILLVLNLAVSAQDFYLKGATEKIALVLYEKDDNGFFQKRENVKVENVSNVVANYMYDKKNHQLYVETEQANVVVRVTDEMHELLRKNKAIPQVKEKYMAEKVNSVNRQLEEKFFFRNEERQKFINDSIQKAKDDSIKKAKEDSIKEVQLKKLADEYRYTHKWYSIHTKKNNLHCVLCDKDFEEDSLFCLGIKNDTLYWMKPEFGYLGNEYWENHIAKVPQKLLDDYDYQYHCKVFADSLIEREDILDKSFLEPINAQDFYGYLNNLKKQAPYGFFLDWGWGSEYSVSFHFSYLNTNKKTIKYIEVFWKITNDVGDVRRTGSFKGTGPLAEWESASWDWDYSSYYVAGDATRMDITKLIITYMDGTKITVPKNKIVFD